MFLKMFSDFLDLLLLYHCPYDVFIAVCHCVMCVCRISIKITYLLINNTANISETVLNRDWLLQTTNRKS